MERTEALYIFVGGLIAMAGSTLPFLFMTIRAIKRSFNRDDEISLPIMIFWIYIVQLMASMGVMLMFYVFDLFNKGAKYTITGSVEKFWTLSNALLQSNEKVEVLAVVSMCLTYKSIFIFMNGITPLLCSLLGFFAGFWRTYQDAKRNGDTALMPLFWGFVGSVLAYIFYYSYASIATESLYINTPLHELAREFWQ